MSVRIEDGLPWIGDRSFPWASKVESLDAPMSLGASTFRVRLFHLTFENGWTLSVSFGSGSYTENHSRWTNGGPFHEEVDTVEIALWDKDNIWATWSDRGGDEVRSSTTEAELLHIIEIASQFPFSGLATANPPMVAIGMGGG